MAEEQMDFGQALDTCLMGEEEYVGHAAAVIQVLGELEE